MNIHLHCLVLDGVYRCGADGLPTFIEAAVPNDDELHALLQTVISRLMTMLMRRGVLIEAMGQTCLAEPDADGEEARTLRSAMPREGTARQPLCAAIDGFSLHTAVRVEIHGRKRLQQLCRYITRSALLEGRMQLKAAGPKVKQWALPQARPALALGVVEGVQSKAQ